MTTTAARSTALLPKPPTWPTVVVLLVALTAAVPGELAAADKLVIESDSVCPSAATVRKALLALRSADDWPSTTVSIRVTEQMLYVDLGSGAASARPIPVTSDCDALAATVALVVATWTSDLPAQTVTSPILQPTATESAERRPLDVATAKTQPNYREVGFGPLVAFGGGVAPGIRLDVVSLRRDSGVGWQASLAVPAGRELAVGSGKTGWTRASVGLALHVRRAKDRFFLSGDAGVAIAYTVAWGQGYATNEIDQSLTWGPYLGVRGGLAWKRLRIWSDLRGGRWLYGQSVQVDSGADSVGVRASLPAWDVQWALGASYPF